jgi:hypothetical protein
MNDIHQIWRDVLFVIATLFWINSESVEVHMIAINSV